MTAPRPPAADDRDRAQHLPARGHPGGAGVGHLHHLGPLVFGQPVVWSFHHVGAYYLPDIARLLVLAVAPNLIQAAYMTGAGAIDGRGRQPHAARGGEAGVSHTGGHDQPTPPTPTNRRPQPPTGT